MGRKESNQTKNKILVNRYFNKQLKDPDEML